MNNKEKPDNVLEVSVRACRFFGELKAFEEVVATIVLSITTFSLEMRETIDFLMEEKQGNNLKVVGGVSVNQNFAD